MGDFFVDDQFYDHPKALTAGEDAANLYVRGLAWAHRHNTGDIPKNAVATLTTKRDHAKSAKALVEVNLWEDCGKVYRIHDWAVRNAKSIRKREHAKKAARARWEHPPGNADAYAEALPAHMQNSCEGNALPTKEPRNQGTTTPLPPSHPAPDPGIAGAEAAFIEQVVAGVAERQLSKTQRDVPNPSGWLRKARDSIRSEHFATIRTSFVGDLTVDQVVDLIEPPNAKRPDPQASRIGAFHEMGCVCAGQGTDRTCSRSPVDDHAAV